MHHGRLVSCRLMIDRMPLTFPSPRLSSPEPSPSTDSSFDHACLNSSTVPSIQLTPPMASGAWSRGPLSPKRPSSNHSRPSSVLMEALHSTHQRPHKWVHLFVFLTCLSLTLVTTFLSVLWFDNTSPLWVYIMSRNWVTRFVATSTLIVRTSIDIQACIAATMLAALFLESKSGVSLIDSVSISIMRFDTTPLTLAFPILRGLSRQRKRLAYTLLSALLICLCTTTVMLQRKFCQLGH